MVGFSKVAAAGLTLAAAAFAHPGEKHDSDHIKRSIEARDLHAQLGARALAGCQNSATARSLKQRAVERRANAVKSLRQKRNIAGQPRRHRRTLANLEAWEKVDTNKTGIDNHDVFSLASTIFDANTSCVLTPENTAGPYYVVGEYFRSNVKEEQYSEGVDLFLEVQYVDIGTCAPVPDVAVDIWNANATGTYSGISTSGNYAADGLNSTYLRGVQLTDHDGVVSFESIFPGHYSGRATHTHLLAHKNVTLAPNGTIQVWNKPVASIGQLFYPEDLRSAVEATYPYSTNTQAVVSNDDDMWSIVQADATYNPFPEFLYLGDDISDGLFAWIQIGINATADYQNDDYYSVAGYLGSDGGHAESNDFGGGSGSGSGPGSINGTAAATSGAASSATSTSTSTA